VALVALAQAQNPAPAAKRTATSGSGKLSLYVAVGPEITQYDVDIESASLEKRGSVTLPAGGDVHVQEAWPDPSNQYIYAAWSNAVPQLPDFKTNPRHGLSVIHIDPTTGALQLHGQPLILKTRPVNLTLDIPGTHVLLADSEPSAVAVRQIMPDKSVGPEVKQRALDLGNYGIQVRVDPSNKTVLFMTRGIAAADGKPEVKGAIKVFGYSNGVLTNRASIAPAGGTNFQARHLDFHPSRPFVYLTLEAQNKLHVYGKTRDGSLTAQPLFVKDLLSDPGNVRPAQTGGTIHVHPNGRVLYAGNRAGGTVEFEGRPVFVGGENTIAVYSINQTTGEPTLIQSADAHGFAARTFGLDPSGRFLVVANQAGMAVRDGSSVRIVPPNLALFRIQKDGTLEFVRKYDLESGQRRAYWVGFFSRR